MWDCLGSVSETESDGVCEDCVSVWVSAICVRTVRGGTVGDEDNKVY